MLGYTNNELSAQQRRDALALVAGHATAGRLTVDREAVPLAEVTEAWTRAAGAAHRADPLNGG